MIFCPLPLLRATRLCQGICAGDPAASSLSADAVAVKLETEVFETQPHSPGAAPGALQDAYRTPPGLISSYNHPNGVRTAELHSACHWHTAPLPGVAATPVPGALAAPTGESQVHSAAVQMHNRVAEGSHARGHTPAGTHSPETSAPAESALTPAEPAAVYTAAAAPPAPDAALPPVDNERMVGLDVDVDVDWEADPVDPAAEDTGMALDDAEGLPDFGSGGEPPGRQEEASSSNVDWVLNDDALDAEDRDMPVGDMPPGDMPLGADLPSQPAV